MKRSTIVDGFNRDGVLVERWHFNLKEEVCPGCPTARIPEDLGGILERMAGQNPTVVRMTIDIAW